VIGTRTSLRWRVTLAFTLLGGFLSGLFAGATVYMAEDYEHVLVDEILRGQAEDYSLRLTSHPEMQLPQTHRLSGFFRRPDGSGEVPAELIGMGPGIHEFDDAEDEDEDWGWDWDEEGNDEHEGIHIGVFDIARGRLYLVIDLSDIERLERHLTTFLAGVVVLGTGLSGWLGWVLAGATIAPVRKLAAAVDALPTRAQRTDLAADLGPDELGRLAQAIDGYQSRLVDADAVEREFFADASHELRTPVAVVRGAVELLLDEPAADAGTQRRLQRLDRGVRELTELLDMLLGLVRRSEPDIVTVETEGLLRACTEGWSNSSGPQRLWIDIEAEGMQQLPHREALLIVQGVLRRMMPPDPMGRLSLRLRESVLDLEFRVDPDATMAPEHVARNRSDRGLGLTLIGRLAERIGWRIEEIASDPARRQVRITWPNGGPVEKPVAQ